MCLMMPWPLPSSFSFLPPDVLLQDHMTAGQNAPQRSLSSQQEAAIRMLFTCPLQQVLEKENGTKTLNSLIPAFEFNHEITDNYMFVCFYF